MLRRRPVNGIASGALDAEWTRRAAGGHRPAWFHAVRRRRTCRDRHRRQRLSRRRLLGVGHPPGNISGEDWRFQFTRYEAGEYYGPHFDIGPGKLTERKLSLTVQLSAPEEYTGGELIIYPEFVAPKDQGTMTVFPSFMCHNVNPVKTGVRYSLVSWLAGPPFK